MNNINLGFYSFILLNIHSACYVLTLLNASVIIYNQQHFCSMNSTLLKLLEGIEVF